jgi:AcrR family transcriptional regulator
LRNQARDETHRKIFDATVRVVVEQGVHAFTLNNVAQVAGIAARTLYRHFPTREALIEGLAATMEEGPSGTPLPVPPVSEWEAVLSKTFDQFSAQAERVRIVHAAAVALQHRIPARHTRTLQFQKRVAEAFPHLPPAVRSDAANLLRSLLSSSNWLVLTVEHGMSPPAAKRAVTWALRTLLLDLSARNAAGMAVKGRPRGGTFRSDHSRAPGVRCPIATRGDPHQKIPTNVASGPR